MMTGHRARPLPRPQIGLGIGTFGRGARAAIPKTTTIAALVGFGDRTGDGLKTSFTGAETKLSKEVRNDISTPSGQKASLTYFGSPIVGVVSQEFDMKNHPGIDVVTTKDKTIKACLAGTVLYSGYSRKDGYILIIGHSGNFISVYKHNKTVLKKMGAKVQLGDPIAIVGNTGENSDGPHLHFELWYNQIPVNPSDYIKFTR